MSHDHEPPAPTRTPGQQFDIDRFRVSTANHTPSPEGIEAIRQVREAAAVFVEVIADGPEPQLPPDARGSIGDPDRLRLHVASGARQEAIRLVERAVAAAVKSIALATGTPTDGNPLQ